MFEMLFSSLQVAFFLALFVGAWFTGSSLERKHLGSIEAREAAAVGFPTTTFLEPAASWDVQRSGLVTGNFVVSVDYFKRIIASLYGIVGGRVTVYESILDRARREAVLRMRESAIAQGYDAVVNVRIETSRLASSRKDGKGTAGVEILAIGTGVERSV